VCSRSASALVQPARTAPVVDGGRDGNVATGRGADAHAHACAVTHAGTGITGEEALLAAGARPDAGGDRAL